MIMAQIKSMVAFLIIYGRPPFESAAQSRRKSSPAAHVLLGRWCGPSSSSSILVVYVLRELNHSKLKWIMMYVCMYVFEKNPNSQRRWRKDKRKTKEKRWMWTGRHHIQMPMESKKIWQVTLMTPYQSLSLSQSHTHGESRIISTVVGQLNNYWSLSTTNNATLQE